MEIGDSKPLSRASVYRILQTELDRQEVRSRVRSVGWTGEDLILRTRDGAEIKVERSKPFWKSK